MMHLADIRKVNLVFDRVSGKLPVVSVDQEKIRAVIQNLLDNAIKYSKPGGNVEIAVNQKGDCMQVAVKDDGIGIPENQQKLIFNRFFRAKNARKSNGEGNGLGLNIAKSIIERHGGKIWFESEENKGSIFYFTLKI